VRRGDNYIFDMRIGNLTIDGRVVLAPMAGVTDLAFRRICRRFGAAIVYSEFLSTDGLVFKSRKQVHKLLIASDEHPVAFQLFGSRIQTFSVAAKQLEELGPDLIDLNFGCPVKKVVKKNGGAAVLRDLELMGKIVAETSGAVSVPVTVKMRAGWDQDGLVYHDAALIAVDAGAKVLTLHARTRADSYEAPACWDYIADLKAISTVPVIGNGDIDSPQRARDMLERTGCDAVMVGRAALGRPWIFAEINHFLQTGETLPPPRLEDRLGLAWQHLKTKVAQVDREIVAVKMMRKQMSSYVTGLPMASRLRGEIMKAESLDGIRGILNTYLDSLGAEQRQDGDGWLSEYIPIDRTWRRRTMVAA
jgi:tRNA-dihydrouridine synthase B